MKIKKVQHIHHYFNPSCISLQPRRRQQTTGKNCAPYTKKTISSCKKKSPGYGIAAEVGNLQWVQVFDVLRYFWYLCNTKTERKNAWVVNQASIDAIAALRRAHIHLYIYIAFRARARRCASDRHRGRILCVSSASRAHQYISYIVA